MNWINVKDRTPVEKDSPVLAFAKDTHENCLSYAALHWLDGMSGWRGEGWYDWCDEYGMGVEDMSHWMPLPEPPKPTIKEEDKC